MYTYVCGCYSTDFVNLSNSYINAISTDISPFCALDVAWCIHPNQLVQSSSFENGMRWVNDSAFLALEVLTLWNTATLPQRIRFHCFIERSLFKWLCMVVSCTPPSGVKSTHDKYPTRWIYLLRMKSSVIPSPSYKRCAIIAFAGPLHKYTQPRSCNIRL